MPTKHTMYRDHSIKHRTHARGEDITIEKNGFYLGTAKSHDHAKKRIDKIVDGERYGEAKHKGKKPGETLDEHH